MYSLMHADAGADKLDFWWIKPSRTDPAVLEEVTLNRQEKGPFKNDPGRSRALYSQFCDLFGRDSISSSSWAFGWEEAAGTMRATIVDRASGEKLFFFLIWQEDWTTNPLARNKYIRGKIVYQKDATQPVYYSRQYTFANSRLTIFPYEERLSGGKALPPDSLKRLPAKDEIQL